MKIVSQRCVQDRKASPGGSESQPIAAGRDCLVTGHSSREVVTQGRAIQCWSPSLQSWEVAPIPGVLLIEKAMCQQELLQPVSKMLP